jgi:hypothetical protein
MRKTFDRRNLVAIFGGSALVVTLMTGVSEAREVELECRAGSERTVDFDASHETWTSGGQQRREFEADIDIEDGRGYAAGQAVGFFVDGKRVASRNLVRERDGDLAAEIEFKSWKTSGVSRFPKGFPAVKAGTVVEVRSKGKAILSCALR